MICFPQSAKTKPLNKKINLNYISYFIYLNYTWTQGVGLGLNGGSAVTLCQSLGNVSNRSSARLGLTTSHVSDKKVLFKKEYFKGNAAVNDPIESRILLNLFFTTLRV